MINDILDSFTVGELKTRLNLIPASQSAGQSRPTRKADIIAAIRDYMLSAGCREVWERLDPDERLVVAETVHHGAGQLDRSRFIAKHGSLPEALANRQYGYVRNRPKPKQSYLPLFFYGQTIPPELCTRLAEFVPVPADDAMKTVAEEAIPEWVLEEPDDEPDADRVIRRLSTEAIARQDLAGLLRLVDSGQLSVSEKTGMAGAAALRKIDGLLAGGDWFSPQDEPQLRKWEGGPVRPMRPFAWPLLLQAGGLAKAKGKTLELTRKGKAALRAPFEQTIRELYTRWRDRGSWDEFRRIDMIKGQTSKGRPMAAVVPRRQAIEQTLRECPPGEWVEIQEFYRYSLARGHGFEVARDEWKLYINSADYGSMGYAPTSILDLRYLMVYFMEYLATLGVVDIGYTNPMFGRADYGDLWGVDELHYLSRYDGLLYLRLNSLGAYCLGLSEAYAPPLTEAGALLEVDEDLRIRLRRPAEAAQAMLLDQYAQPLSDEQWQLTPDALLAMVEQGLELDEFHQFLQQQAAAELPAAVASLFDKITARRSAVLDAGSARLLRCASADFARALAKDPKLSDYCHYVGGRTLVVPDKGMKRFREALRRIGYVIPV